MLTRDPTRLRHTQGEAPEQWCSGGEVVGAPRVTAWEDPGGYRPNVGICLANPQGLVFAGRRADTPDGDWQMPQGGIDWAEEPGEALFRELAEETGVDRGSVEVLAEVEEWLTYDFPTTVVGAHSGVELRYRGQRQKWFLCRFHGDDAGIDLAAQDVEFSEWRWMPLADLPPGVVDFKQGVYHRVAQEFLPLLRGEPGAGAEACGDDGDAAARSR